MLTEVFWLLDPLEHNPWPHHATIIGCEPWRKSHGLLPRWASASHRPGRGQSADHPAFAPGCENSLQSDCPRDHVRSDKWARAGRCRGHLAIRSREPESVFAMKPWSRSEQRLPRAFMARALTADCRPAGRLAIDQDWGGPNSDLSACDVTDILKEAPFGAAWKHNRGAKLAVCASLAQTSRIAGADRNRASFAQPFLREGVRRGTRRPTEIQRIDQRARRRRPIPVVR